MTTPFQHDSANLSPSGGSPPGQRKKLQLKPRSCQPLDVPRSPRPERSRRMSAKGDPFGEALPREQVLKQRGIDPAQEDVRFARKAEIARFTREQEMEVEAVRAELTKVESQFRNANEMELPEEEFRVAMESKRKELNDLMQKFTEMNTGTAASTASDVKSSTARATERPSEHRRRKEQDDMPHRGRHHGTVDDAADGVFASFSSNRRRRKSPRPQAEAY